MLLLVPLRGSQKSKIIGIVVFSGSLYALSTTGIKWLGAITPVGGLAFIIGWISIAIASAPHFVRSRHGILGRVVNYKKSAFFGVFTTYCVEK